MYVFKHTGQLSIEEFHSPFGGKLDPNNRWVRDFCWRPALMRRNGRWRALDRRRGTLRGPAVLAPWLPPAFWFTAISGRADSAQGSNPSLGVADRGGDVLLGGGQGVHLKHLAHDAAKAAALVPMGHCLHRHAVPQPAGIGRGEGRSASRPLRPESFLQTQRSSSVAGSAAGSSADSPIRCRSMPRPRGWRCSCTERGAAAGRPGWWHGSDPTRSG